VFTLNPIQGARGALTVVIQSRDAAIFCIGTITAEALITHTLSRAPKICHSKKTSSKKCASVRLGRFYK
jgi:hypothetical protein